jgi:hypothetical protein
MREGPTIMYLIAFPLLLIPFALYNIVAFILNLPFTDTVFSIPLWPPERRMPVTTGDLLVAVGMLLLYFEAIKAARLGIRRGMDHLLAFIVFLAMAGELALLPGAATPTLLLLTVLGFVDVITGLSISVHGKEREIVIEDAERP